MRGPKKVANVSQQTMLKTNSAKHRKCPSFKTPQKCLWVSLIVKLIKYKNSLHYSTVMQIKESYASRLGPRSGLHI